MFSLMLLYGAALINLLVMTGPCERPSATPDPSISFFETSAHAPLPFILLDATRLRMIAFRTYLAIPTRTLNLVILRFPRYAFCTLCRRDSCHHEFGPRYIRTICPF
ncbi:hypothetical protein BGW80DRAFT_1299430 [Lactifluus volemus]|nr:hypothetical protein BGW80DRAFT_1299430 [Lactifluus volemus]